MTEVGTLFIARPQLRRITLAAVAQLNTRRVDLENVVEQVVLIKVSSGSFILLLSVLFHHCSTSIYLFISYSIQKQQITTFLKQINHT
jgi:hypothetical protein